MKPKVVLYETNIDFKLKIQLWRTSNSVALKMQ